jgi:hypothetical protein
MTVKYPVSLLEEQSLSNPSRTSLQSTRATFLANGSAKMSKTNKVHNQLAAEETQHLLQQLTATAPTTTSACNHFRVDLCIAVEHLSNPLLISGRMNCYCSCIILYLDKRLYQ